MIPSLVDTSLDFGLFRVVRPHVISAAILKNANLGTSPEESFGIFFSL